jgi:transposase
VHKHVDEIDADEPEATLDRVAAIDVAKRSGKVCVRLPHPSVPERRSTKVWDVASTTNAIVELAYERAEMDIERVVLEATSDYWRPFLYLLEARGLSVWLVNAHDAKQVPGRPKTSWTPCGWPS